MITQISQSGGPTPKGQQATFTAIGSDPDQDQLTWTWATRSGACKDLRDPANWPKDTFSGESDAPTTYVVDDSSLTKSTGYCVWVFATDRYGAFDVQHLDVAPTNNLPVVTLQMVVDPDQKIPPTGPPYPAYTRFQLSASVTDADDGDTLTSTWSISQRPPNSSVDFIPCAGQRSVDDSMRCFTADLPGPYVVTLAVSDGTSTVTATTPNLTVLDDQPPCIVETTPSFMIDPNMPTKALTVPGALPDPGMLVNTVYDDGNPVPPRNSSKLPTFTWYKATNDGDLQYVDNVDFKQLTLSMGDYQLFDYVNIRLEVKDQNSNYIDQLLATCGKKADFCAAPVMVPGQPNCWVRVSWRIHLTDDASTPAPTTTP